MKAVQRIRLIRIIEKMEKNPIRIYSTLPYLEQTCSGREILIPFLYMDVWRFLRITGLTSPARATWIPAAHFLRVIITQHFRLFRDMVSSLVQMSSEVIPPDTATTCTRIRKSSPLLLGLDAAEAVHVPDYSPDPWIIPDSTEPECWKTGIPCILLSN